VTRRRWLWILGLASLALFVVLAAIDVRMQDAGGWGIVDFEVAGSRAGAQDILADWGSRGQDAARLSLWLDYLYLVAYGAFWALAASAVRDLSGRLGWQRFAAIGPAMVVAAIGAAVFDALEDVGLLLALGGHGGEVAPVVAAICAGFKFLLLIVVTLYVAIALVRWGLERRRRLTVAVLGLLVALLALLAVNAVLTSSQTESADASAPGQIVPLPGGDLHVIDEGPRGPSAIVLIHGYTSSIAWWDRDAQILSADRRVIRVDLLGHGASAKPARGYGMAEQGARVLAALRKLGVKRALVVGHSLGGSVAVAMAQQDPKLVRGVVVIGTESDDTYEEGPGTLRWLFTPGIGQALKQTLPDSAIRQTLESAAFAHDAKVPQQWVDDSRRVTYTALVESRQAFSDFEDERPLKDRMAATGLPVLAIFGSKDNSVHSAPQVAARWRGPHVQVVVLPGLGHTPQYEQPELTAGLIERFTNSVLGPPRRRR
jgi:pimeloyl-ACP methyl ester carboxylesterase